MVQPTQLAEEDRVALTRKGYPAPAEPSQWDPKVFGLPDYARLQVPLSAARTADILAVLDDLSNQVRQLRRKNYDQDWIYASELYTLIKAANLRLQTKTKPGSQK